MTLAAAEPPPGAPACASRLRRRVWAWLALGALYLLLRVPALVAWSPTYDEPIYIGAGKYFALTDEPRLAATLYHPPLAFHLTSLPLWLLDTPHPPWNPEAPAGQIGLEVLYGTRLPFSGDVVDPFWILLLSRLPVLIAGVLGMVLVRDLAMRLAGERAGWIAAGAWALHPDAAAHGVLATTDLVAAVAALILALATLRWIEAPTIVRTAAVGAAAGLALLAKHSLLVLVALAAVLLLAHALRRRRRDGFAFGWIAQRVVVAACVSLFTLWAGYLFEFGPVATASGGSHEQSLALSKLLHVSPGAIAAWAENLSVPAPSYVRSLADALLEKARARAGATWIAYLNGEWRPEGFLSYFVVALAVKTPLSHLLLLVSGLSAWWWVRRRARAAADLCLLFFAGLLVAASLSRLNIGIRHLLPAIPFGIALGAAAMDLLLDRIPRTARAAGLLAAVALGAELATNWVEPLSFANLASGGPSRLHRVLSDSNLELGQDLWRLERWATDRGASGICCLLHHPQGLYEREVARRRVLLPLSVMESRSVLPGGAEESPPPRDGEYLAVGEAVLTLPRYRALLDIPPIDIVGRSRIYRLGP